MRARRMKAYIRLLDIKALCEFFANVDSYVATFPLEGNKACVVVPLVGQNADMGKIMFELLIRIKLAMFAQFFGSTELTSIEQFFAGIRSTQFIDFIKSCEQQICNAEYVDSNWSPHTFHMNINSLVADMSRYQEYCDHLYSLVSDEYSKILSNDSDVLSVYCKLPLLQEGLVRRIVSADTFNTIMSQRSVLSGLLFEYEHFCSKLTLADDANMNTVIYKYLADQIRHFKIAWFESLQYKYITGKVSVKGADDRQIYTADLMHLKTSTTKHDINLYEVFSLVNKIDTFLFQRLKGIGYSYPYLSITDLVLRNISNQKYVGLRKISADSKVLYNCTFVGRDALAGLEQSSNQQKNDMFVDRQFLLRRTDMTFQAKIRYNSKLITDIIDKAQYISFDDFHDVLYKIITEHTHGRAYKDSDKPCFDMVTPLGYKSHSEVLSDAVAQMSTSEQLNLDAKYSIIADSVYEIISDIILAINKLLELNEILESYGTSLAVVWSQYLLKFPNQSLNIFIQCSTVPAFLNYLGIAPIASLSKSYDDGFETNGSYYMQVSMTIRNQIYSIINSPAPTKQSPCILEFQLGKARMPVVSEDDGKIAIQQSYIKFSKAMPWLPDNFFDKFVDFINKTLCLQRVTKVNKNYRLTQRTQYSFSDVAISPCEFASFWTNSVLSTILNKPVAEQQLFITEINKCIDAGLFTSLIWWVHTESIESDTLVTSLLDCFTKDINNTDFSCVKIFIHVADSITQKGIGTKQYPGIGITQALEDDDMQQFKPACQLYNLIFGFFIIIYELTTSGFLSLNFEDAITPLSDMNFILDSGFSSILLRELIAKEANTYVTSSSKYLCCLNDVNFNSLFATKTEKNNKKETFYIDIAHALSYVGKSFALMDTEFLGPLKYSGDIVFGGQSSDIMPLDNFRISLSKANINLFPVCNSQFSRVRTINEELVLILCGTIRSALSTINFYYGNTFRQLHAEDNVFRNYVKYVMHLSQTKAISNKNAINFSFHLNEDFYNSVFKSDAYLKAQARNMFTAPEALKELKVELQDCALDGNYYRQRNGAYVCIYNKSNGRSYYLTKDLVYVGQAANGIADIRAAAEIQF